MTRANLSELPALVELAVSLGADEIVATNIAYSPSLAVDEMRVFGAEPQAEDEETVNRARETARRLGIPLRLFPLRTDREVLVCDADPINTVYINHNGEVAPCVYLGLTVQGQIPRFFQGEEHPFEMVSFGNVRQGFSEVLHGRKREAFVDVFRRRAERPDLLAVVDYVAGERGGDEMPPPPSPCQSCYKMLGI